MTAPLYTADILRLAASIPGQRPLKDAQATIMRRSPVCGSRVTTSVNLDCYGRVVDFGQEVQACALGQAAAAILGQAILGQTPENLRMAHEALASWLKSDDTLPEFLAAHYPQLALFEPARAHAARHPSICLAFDAAAAAAEQAISQAPGRAAVDREPAAPACRGAPAQR
ncbi:MAG: iron-sulfur cluster assembly scaffold protein [Sphingomonadaceae bacterium]